jgi:hypothetical protein
MNDKQIPHPENTPLNPNYMDMFRRNVFLSDGDPVATNSPTTGVTYFGYTIPGVLETEPYWLIKRTEINSTSTYSKYSNTGKTYTDIWNERTGLTYY